MDAAIDTGVEILMHHRKRIYNDANLAGEPEITEVGGTSTSQRRRHSRTNVVPKRPSCTPPYNDWNLIPKPPHLNHASVIIAGTWPGAAYSSSLLP